MFWADEILKDRKGKEVINDSWTPSGIVHMGSLKGPVIHDVMHRVLREKGTDVKFIYGFDDADPIDGLPPDLQESHSKYLGIPINVAPSPDGKGTFADFYINKMKKLLATLDIQAELYRTSEIYKSGRFNEAIKYVLDYVGDIQKVYSEVYKKEIAKDWYPLQVICPECGKVGTTKVTEWDGKEVSYECSKTLVKWAEGCGKTGKISPFDGRSKMSWKVEWAAKWWVLGVTIEAAGKDHASAGGSYDVAMKILKDVFHKKEPMKMGYEFFLSGGKKMSSSKGLGMTGEELLEVFAPQVARFLMIKTHPAKAVEFTPRGTDAIAKVYDDYKNAYEWGFDLKSDEDSKRVFELAQVDNEIKKPPTLRFMDLANLVQDPKMYATIKSEEEWATYARVWLEKYAPESEKFFVQENLPEAAKDLSEKQKGLLKMLASELDKDLNAENFQIRIYELGKELGLTGKETFAAIYSALIGKDHGPKAAWLILSLDRKFVNKRFNEVSNYSSSEDPPVGGDESRSASTSSGLNSSRLTSFARTIKPEIFSINSELAKKLPSVSVGIAVIKGVSVKEKNSELEKEKEALLKSLENLTTEELGQYPEVISYRKLYKEMGIDWHSRRPSPEALLRRVALKKGLYTINTCVDAYNLVVMKHRVSIGAFDLDKVKFPTVLRFSKEGEEILLLGDTEPTKYKDGEVAYFDKEGGFNIDFNYRDSQRTAVKTETKNLYINVDGVHDISPQKVKEVLREAVDMIIKYCGGKLEIFGIETAE